MTEQLSKLKQTNEQMLYDLKHIDMDTKQLLTEKDKQIAVLNKRVEYLEYQNMNIDKEINALEAEIDVN
jgi:hypothetical protein